MSFGNHKKTYLWKHRLLGIFYPPRCPVCDGLLEQEEAVYEHSGSAVFSGVHTCCTGKIPVVEGPVCMHCGRPVDGETREFCFDCGRTIQNRCFRQGKALFLYQGQMKAMMYRFKYGGRQEYAAFFAYCTVRSYAAWLEKIQPEAILPVPMYRKKEKKRGYNQAAVFAKQLAELTGIPCILGGVRRIRDTRPMKNLNDIERKNNLKNAFQIENRIVKYNRVLVVDDIYTTGATADAVAGSLGEAGINTVYFLAICIGKGC